MKKGLQYRWRERKFVFASVLLLLLAFVGRLNAQNQANIWYFGEKVGLDFNSGAPVTLCDGAQSACNYEGEGFASISSATGNLLFYTNGVTVWDRAHTAMTNGTGLMGHLSSNQSATIVPMPGSATKYYIFTVPAVEGSNGAGGSNDPQNGLRYSIVDMTLRAGFGDVVAASKNTQLTPAGTSVMEAQTVVPHSNGTDWWLLAHRAGDRTTGAASNTFYAFQVTSSGINAAVTSNVGYSVAGCISPTCSTPVSSSIGSMKSNSCYTSIALGFYGQGATSGRVQVLPFNNTTGAVSAPTHDITNFNNRNEIYSVEFSPNGNYLYASELSTNYLFQFDLTVPANVNTAGARTTLANAGYGGASPDRTGSIQLGPDGKIYVARHKAWCPGAASATNLGVVTNPDVFPASYNATGVTFNCVGWVSHGLPQFAKSFIANSLVAKANKVIACPGDNINFSYTFSGVRSSVSWNFGDASSSTSDAPTHSYASSGTKTVTLTVTDACGRNTSDNLSVNILDNTPPAGNISCSTPSITLNGTGANAANYRWFDAATGGTLVGTGATVNKTYTPMSSTPSSFWVEDATAAAAYGPLQTRANSQGYGSVQNSSFTTLKPLTLTSVQIKMYCGWCPGVNNLSVTVSLGAQSKTFTFSGDVDLNTTQTLDLNFAIPTPGTYTLNISPGSNPAYFNEDFSAVTGGSIAGVATFNASPDNAAKTGPFFNFNFLDLNPCKSRVQVNRLCALPIELLSFEGKYISDQVHLDWITLSEINNEYYVIERSTDGINFSSIGKVSGYGNTNSISNYVFVDEKAPSGIVYYRLVQFDYDGTSRIVGLAKVASRNAGLSLKAYPNPFTQATTVNVISEEASVAFKLIDINGKIVLEDKYFKTNQTTELGGELPSGVYIVQVSGSNQNLNFKLIKE